MEPIEVDILDHGKVVLIDVFGSDQRIATTARTSYQKATKKVNTDEGLIRYLFRHRHTSPVEMAEVLFYLRIPIFVARQLVRHRTANINEVSGRYSELPDDAYIPVIDQLGPQSSQNNQGRAPVSDLNAAKKSRSSIQYSTTDSFAVYDDLLHQSKVSREVSRVVLPLNTYTEMYWKCDLHNFLHMIHLRMDSHAQYEIRVMATAMYELVKPFFPATCHAFEDYILNGKTLSALEQQLLSSVLVLTNIPTQSRAAEIGMSKREYTDFMDWISTLSNNRR